MPTRTTPGGLGPPRKRTREGASKSPLPRKRVLISPMAPSGSAPGQPPKEEASKTKIPPVAKSGGKPHKATFPPKPKCATGEGIALIELFAGLRTAPLAARCEGLAVVAHLTAEICPFANIVTEKNFHDDDKRAGFSALHIDDVNEISQELIEAWVKCIYSSKTKAKVAVMVAGIPCKGSSRCRDTGRAFESRPGLKDA